MEGGSFFKNPAIHYSVRILSAIWRRKSALFCVLLIVLVLALCIQYNVTREMLIRSEPFKLQQPISTSSAPPRKLLISDDDQRSSSADKESGNDIRFVLSNEQQQQQPSVDNDLLSNYKASVPLADQSSLASNVVYVPAQRLIHLDLKGAPPKVQFIKEFFKYVKNLGATGVLLEWEDMFPWTDNLSVLAATNAYTVDEVREIIRSAEQLDLEVIPLVQTFGHLEFALKNPEFIHLREVPESPQALCPSLNASLELVQDIIDQVMKIHRDANFLHIGCDEVFHLGECARCRTKARETLFLSHLSEVATYVRRKYVRVTPIIWDDMLRHLPLSLMQMYGIGQLVEPMVWVYAEDVYRFVPQTVWDKYSVIFPYVWTASAFKGAFGETYYIPNAKRHLDNNFSWLNVMANENLKFRKGIRGLVLTGWQRYDHFAVLCELLPAAIPCLTANLVAISHGYTNANNQTFKDSLYQALNCGVTVTSGSGAAASFFSFENDPFLWDHFGRCSFLGGGYYRLLSRLHLLEKDVKEFLHSTKEAKGWMTEYNVRRNYSSPLRVDELMAEESRIYHSLTSYIPLVQSCLQDIFDEYTIAEWIEQKIYPMISQMETLRKDAKILKKPKIWPRRPLPVFAELDKFGFSFSSIISNNNNNDLSNRNNQTGR